MVSFETITQITERLRNLGYQEVEENMQEIIFWANLMYDVITSDLCRDEIPKPLWRVYIDKVCGEFLYDKYVRGDLDDWLGDPGHLGSGDVTQVMLGDMTVEFQDGITTDTDIFLGNVGYLREHPDFRYLFDIFRDFLR